jgi:hypothetical protein
MLDYDMDGFLDIFIPSQDYGSLVFHNCGNSNNWIGLKLQGTQSNRDAIGTLVKVYTGDICQMRYTRVGTTWKTQDNPFVHVGIGEATIIDSVVIRWPLGLKEVYTNLSINQYHEIKEGDASSAVIVSDQLIPSDYFLGQNYPNPFNGSTQIIYRVAEASLVTLKIFNLQGQLIETLIEEIQSAGQHVVNWNGKSRSGAEVASGVYIYRLETKHRVEIKKMLYLP